MGKREKERIKENESTRKDQLAPYINHKHL